MDNADRIQAVINTLETLTIPATYDNVSRITGIYQALFEVRDSLQKGDGNHDGETDVR